jgi:predicted amidohydrolase YtcJ
MFWWIRPPARVAYVGGAVFSMDAENRIGGGVALQGDRIVRVGSEAEIREWAESARAHVVELAGRAVLPGFVDAHSHFPGAGIDVIAVHLNAPPIGTIASMAQLAGALKAKAAATRDGDWIFGIGYDDSLLAERRHPTRADLDAVSTRHPIGLMHVSGHLAAVNSLALERLGPSTPASTRPNG